MTERSKGTDRIPQIFEAITCILEEDGLSAVTFNSVAARCYMHKTAIAYYFQGKEDMLIQYFKFMQTQQDSRIPHLFPGCDPVEVFSAFLDNRLHMALLDLPWIRAKYQFLLTSNPDDEFLLQFTVNISSTQHCRGAPGGEHGPVVRLCLLPAVSAAVRLLSQLSGICVSAGKGAA